MKDLPKPSMTWNPICERLSETVHHYKFSDANGHILSFGQVIQLWSQQTAEGQQFRSFTVRTLVASPFETFRWETPVVDLSRQDREFEFVLINSPGLDRRENRSAFDRQFSDASLDELAIVFPNLGRDAILVVPTPNSNNTSDKGESKQINYCHLASFLRSGSAAQADQLWQKVGAAMVERLSDKPVWLNTAGGGVAWLHFRLDDRPKYYSYPPFKRS